MRIPGFLRNAILVLAALQLVSCATAGPVKDLPAKHPPEMQEEVEKALAADAAMEEKKPVKPPDFVPVREDLSPLRTTSVTVNARNTPLRDVIYSIAEAAGLNVVMEKGVNDETPVTVSLQNISAEDALATVLSSVDYFFSLKDNILVIKATDTRVFEFGQPSIIQDYAVDVGGDMLGATKTGVSGVAGSVSQKVSSDKDSFKLWDSMEKAIGSMLAPSAGPSAIKSSQPLSTFNINRMTGVIVVTATKKELTKVENYLNALKKVLKRQVMVEARIVEVQLSDSLKYGIDWNRLIKVDNSTNITLGTTGFTNAVGSSLPNFNISVIGANFTGLLKALQQQGDVSVLSNPRLNIMNGQTALLSVGRKVDYISRVETTSTGLTTTSVPLVTFSVEISSVLSGIIFGIVPYISWENDRGEVSMTITPIVSNLIDLAEKTVGTTGQNSVQISLPTVDLRELSTTVKVRDGEMIVIGGLINRNDNFQENKVPFIANIPILGYLFKSHDNTNQKTELVVMLRPVIVTR